MYNRVSNVTSDLENLCASVESNQKNVTRITNGLWRIKILTIDDFIALPVDEIADRIAKRTGQRIGKKTMSTLNEMHEMGIYQTKRV